MPDWVRNLALAASALAVAAAAAEGCARAVDLRPAPAGNAIPAWVEDRQLRREAHWLELLARSGALARYFELYQWDRFLFYRVRPDLTLSLLDYAAPPAVRARTAWTVRTNGLGFRDAPLAAEGDGPARFRVLALGDSSTFGWGVPAPRRYTNVAQTILARRRPEAGVEIRNLGVPGYSSFQGLVLLRRVALDLEPDALLFSFGSNDRTPTGVADREVYARRASFLGALQALLRRSRAYETLAAWTGVALGRDRPDRERLARRGRQNVSRREYAENLREAARLARDRGLPFAFVSNCLDREGLRVMAGAARAAGVPFLNGHDTMMSQLEALRGGRLWPEEVARVRRTYGDDALKRLGARLLVLLPDGCHPNRVGHRLIGRALADLVEDWLPPAPEPARALR